MGVVDGAVTLGKKESEEKKAARAAIRSKIALFQQGRLLAETGLAVAFKRIDDLRLAATGWKNTKGLPKQQAALKEALELVRQCKELQAKSIRGKSAETVQRFLADDLSEADVLAKIDELVLAGWENAQTLEEAETNLKEAAFLIEQLMNARRDIDKWAIVS